jgi:hypothetical protein
MGRDDSNVHEVRAVRVDECSVLRVILHAGMVTNKREDDPRPVRCPRRLRRALLGPAERCEGGLTGAPPSSDSYQLFERCAGQIKAIPTVLTSSRTADVFEQHLYSCGADIAQR